MPLSKYLWSATSLAIDLRTHQRICDTRMKPARKWIMRGFASRIRINLNLHAWLFLSPRCTVHVFWQCFLRINAFSHFVIYNPYVQGTPYVDQGINSTMTRMQHTNITRVQCTKYCTRADRCVSLACHLTKIEEHTRVQHTQVST